jgi:hypothetical protein
VLPEGHIIAIRLGEGNNSVLDYLLLPSTEMIKDKIRFMEAGLRRFDGRRYRTPVHLSKAVLDKIGALKADASRRVPASQSRKVCK